MRHRDGHWHAAARAFRPRFSRHERQQIPRRTAMTLRDRKEEFVRRVTAAGGPCWKDSLYEAGRARKVYILCCPAHHPR